MASGSGRKRRTRNKGAARALAASLQDDEDTAPSSPLRSPTAPTTGQTKEPPVVPVAISQAPPTVSVPVAAQVAAPPAEETVPTNVPAATQEAAIEKLQPASTDSAPGLASELAEIGGSACEARSTAPSAPADFQVSFPAGGIGVKLSKPNLHKYAKVKQIMPGGPADMGGVAVGDLLVAIGSDDQLDGEQLALQNTVRKVQSSLQASEEAVYTFRRL